MPRKRLSATTYIGGRFEANLAMKFSALVQSKGTTVQEAMRRLITRAILENEVPGINALELDEQRENAKWGPATPVYDGGNGQSEQRPQQPPQTRKRTTSKEASVPPVA